MFTAVKSAAILEDRQRFRFPDPYIQPTTGWALWGRMRVSPLPLESQSRNGQEVLPPGQVSSATSLSVVHRRHGCRERDSRPRNEHGPGHATVLSWQLSVVLDQGSFTQTSPGTMLTPFRSPRSLWCRATWVPTWQWGMPLAVSYLSFPFEGQTSVSLLLSICCTYRCVPGSY